MRETGADYLAILKQRGKEIKLMRELGIPLPGENTTVSSEEPENDADEELTNEKDN